MEGIHLVSNHYQNVATIYSTNNAFAAVHNDGSVTTWGLHGGDSSSVQPLSNVATIYSNDYAFAALSPISPSLAPNPSNSPTGSPSESPSLTPSSIKFVLFLMVFLV